MYLENPALQGGGQGAHREHDVTGRTEFAAHGRKGVAWVRGEPLAVPYPDWDVINGGGQ